ncbi:MAG: lamin tail domain-containing protein [Clostridiales bacterium]|nr:lamin tail domain-containing protein [Clostridiales bacterium]
MSFSPGIFISEMVTSNGNSLVEDTLGTPDWIELYNSADHPISLAGCHLSDNIREPRKYALPAISLQPGAYFILYCTGYDGALPDGVYHTGFGLSKSGESLYLTDRYLAILDSVDIPPLPQDVSYALSESGAFGYCGVPTPGGPNTTLIADNLESVSYASAGALVELSEVMPVNQNGHTAKDGRRYPWAELYNAGHEPARLLEYYLSDNTANFLKWRLPDVALLPGERAIVYFSDNKDGADGEIHAGFGLGSADSGLYLSNSHGNVVSELAWQLPMAPNIAAVSAGGQTMYTAVPTPGEENSAILFESLTPTPMGDDAPVILNEVLIKNSYSIADSDGDRYEWVELYNRSSQPVSLLGYALSDESNNPAKWLLPDMTIEPDGYTLVFLSGKDRKEGELHASFGLSASNEVMMLTNLGNVTQDVIPLDAAIRANVSMGRDGTGNIRYFATPTPLAQNDSAAFESLSAVPARNASGVYISEVRAVATAKSKKPDWIEFYNPTGKNISLAGWYVSDDIDAYDKYRIQSLTVPAGGYALLYTSSRTARQTDTTGTFCVSSGGETIFLTDPGGILRDYFQTGALRANITAGRDEGDPMGRRVFYFTPSPGAINSGRAYAGQTSTPVFSQTSLYHAAPFTLTISCNTPGARIYYTLDGTKPTGDTALYTAPITIGANTPVRAIALRDGLLESETATQTYLFEEEHTLPVICLTGGQSDIDAVYAAQERAERVEREVHMAYFEAGGRIGTAGNCGLRATGASTLVYAQKSFTMFFRGGYGRDEVTYPFFPGYEIQSFKSLTIRNSGQDHDRARLRNSFFSLAAEGLFVDTIATRPVVMYLNGKYWGIYDLDENQNEDYLAAHYGVDRDAVDIVRRNVSTLAGSNRDYKRIRELGRGDLSSVEKYEAYCAVVDMDYVIDYLITQTYFANGDMFNQKYWRSQDYAVKWRPVLFDLDFGFSANSPTRNILPSYFNYMGVPSRDESLTNMDMFCGLPNNAAWCDRFVKRYVYVVENHFNAQRLTMLLDETAAALRPEMERHIKRWGYPASLRKWEENIKALRDCLDARPAHALKAVQSYFHVSDAAMEEYKLLARQP